MSGASVQKSAEIEETIWKTTEFDMASKASPDVVVIMLGTNDVRKSEWNQGQFFNDYVELIKVFQNLKSKPQVFVTIPPPITLAINYGNYQQDVMNKVVSKMIPEIAAKA